MKHNDIQKQSLEKRLIYGEIASQVYSSLPAAWHSCDLWERELQENLLLFIHKVHPCPVDSYNHIIFRQAWPWVEDKTFNQLMKGVRI